MSERAPITPEQHEAPAEKAEHLEALPTAAQAEALRPGEADPLQKLEQARTSVEQTAEQDNPLAKLQAAEKATESAQPTQVNRELKGITLKRELKQIQRKLPSGQRALSKVIHQPVIRAVSETASKSVSRPSGLLGGGLVAFIGSSSYLWLASHVGFTYNYLVFLLLFVVGFAVGLVLELVVWTFTARRRNVDL